MAIASTMLALGTELPAFTLPDVRSGGTVATDDLKGDALLVMFICNHCPYVKRIMSGLAQFGRDYEGSGLDIVAVASNDATTHPEDSPDELAKVADRNGYVFPVLYDESQDVARAFSAACTPDFFLFDSDRKLVYRGQFDSARPSNEVEVTGEDLRAAV
ncbi:MAG TPA: thioredoxin family protein, partial [Acidimicrobiia bacterium]